MDVLTIRGLSKRFGTKQVLDGLDLTVPAGSIYGFVGRNGAGKTTTMKTVLGLLRPDAGEITVCGERVSFGETATNRLIGYLPDVPEFYPFFTPREYLSLCCEALGMSRADIRVRSEEMLTLVGLSEEQRRIKGFSRGMKQRLGIAQALLARPKLLICDEPTSALDPIGRREILDILLSVRRETTVLFSTHILSDVERICTDVALLDGGRIRRQGTVAALRADRQADSFTVETIHASDADLLAKALPGVSCTGQKTVTFVGDDACMHRVMAYVAENAVAIRRIERVETSLEALFEEVVEA